MINLNADSQFKRSYADLERAMRLAECEIEQKKAQLAELERQLKGVMNERHRYKKRLKALRQRKQAILDLIASPLAFIDPSLQIVCMNRAFTVLTGQSVETVGAFISDRLWGDDAQRLNQLAAKVIKEGGVQQCTIQRDDGKIWESRLDAVLDGDESLIGALFSIHDVTDRMDARQTVQKSEETFRRVLENMPVMVNSLDQNNRIVFWNRECEKVTAYSAEEMQASPDPLAQLYPNPEYRSELYEEWLKRGKHFSNWEMDITCKDGSQRTVSWSNIFQPFRDANYKSWVLGVDITQRKHAQTINRVLFHIADAVNTTFNLDDLYAHIRLSLSPVIDTTNFYIALYDKSDNTLTFPYFIDQADPIPPKPFTQLIDSPTCDVILSKKPLFISQEELIEREKTKRLVGVKPMIWLGAPLIMRDEVIGVMAVQSYTDPDCYSKRDMDVLTAVSNQVALAITRKRDEEALKKSEMRTRMFLDAITESAILCNAQGEVLMVNKAAAEGSGKNAEELIGTDVLDLFPPELEPFPQKMLDRLIQTGKSVCFETEHLGQVHDNTWSPLFDDQNRVAQIAMISIDVTDKRHKDSERLKVQKLEAISTLAGGIAHEFNNALFGITGNLELARMNVPHNASMEKYLQVIDNSAERMRQLTAQLLAYAQGGKYRVRPLSFNQLIMDTLNDIFPNETDPNIRVQTQFQPDLPLVKADAIQMQMVFAGVISNAVEAIKGEGVIKVQTKTQYLEKSALEKRLTEKAATYTCIEITDNGEGMEPETVARVFEPFFTKKFHGRGMGMAAAYGIIKNHHGFIQVRSRFGQGTSVTIGLPAAPNKGPDNS